MRASGKNTFMMQQQAGTKLLTVKPNGAEGTQL